jgi:electron transfer flavoprotein alpha subunit
MSNVLIFTEANSGNVKNVTLEILGKLAGQTVAVASFQDVSDDQIQLLGKHGADKFISLKDTAFEKYSPESYANALTSLIKENSYDFVFSGSTSLAKDLMPRVSAMLEAGMLSELTSFSFDGGTFKGIRPIFAGKCLTEVGFKSDGPKFVTIRPNSLGNPEKENPKSISKEAKTLAPGNAGAKVQDVIKGKSEKADLTEASMIVSGGRSLKSAENFKIIEELADVLGATVGASRAAVDAGYAPHSMQVGQTGKTVSPSLYIACGISGAIQHLAGMRTSKVIVAINTDPDAPIFSKADYGIVGDLFEIVPKMTEELKSFLK